MSIRIPKATHTGELRLGGARIPCAVLEDGRRILSEFGITTAFGSRSGAAKRLKRAQSEDGAPLPVFVASKNLNPFIDDDLRYGLINPVEYQVGNRIAQGFAAELLPQICGVWIDARDAGKLRPQQANKCKQAEILMRALAHVGITALVDEATGYQADRARDALEKILEQFIAQEYRKWIKTFPDAFYEEMFRLKAWSYDPFSVKRPSLVGRYTNDLVYERLAPSVLDELRKKNPADEKGRRRLRHHQWLTEDIGHPRLREHLAAVIALMKASSTWDQFKRSVDRALPKPNQQMLLSDEAE